MHLLRHVVVEMSAVQVLLVVVRWLPLIELMRTSLPSVNLLDEVIDELLVAALIGARLEGALGHLSVLDFLHELGSALVVLLG